MYQVGDRVELFYTAEVGTIRKVTGQALIVKTDNGPVRHVWASYTRPVK